MRLIRRTEDGELSFTDDLFNDGDIPPYAILSHTWGEEEVTFHDMNNGRGSNKAGYNKILFCAQQAAADGLRYCWVIAAASTNRIAQSNMKPSTRCSVGTRTLSDAMSTLRTFRRVSKVKGTDQKQSGKWRSEAADGSPEAGRFKNLSLRLESSSSPKKGYTWVIRRHSNTSSRRSPESQLQPRRAFHQETSV